MGRNSIVKTQKMNMKIPDSAALSAMYTSNNTNAQDSLSKDGGQLKGENSPGGSEVDNDIVMNNNCFYTGSTLDIVFGF